MAEKARWSDWQSRHRRRIGLKIWRRWNRRIWRARLAYDELLAHQLVLALVRRDRKKQQGRAYQSGDELQARLRALLPFPLTGSQESAITILPKDMAAPMRMLRLLQGDVGSGKTVVALWPCCKPWPMVPSRADGTD